MTPIHKINRLHQNKTRIQQKKVNRLNKKFIRNTLKYQK